MTKQELLAWYENLEPVWPPMPPCIEAEDANNVQVRINGEWGNRPYCWALVYAGGKWKYAETDNDRGYVFDFRVFDTEEAAAGYAKKILDLKHRAILGEMKRRGTE